MRTLYHFLISTLKLLIGTKNKGKRIEIGEVLSGLDIECIGPDDIKIFDDPEETEDTYEGNAIVKAEHYYYLSQGIATIADDSGIIVDALQDELGIHTRRWGAGADATDQEWITFFLNRMQKEENKKARFSCTLCYIDSHEQQHLFEGHCEGRITEALQAEYLPGLPISACFIPEGYSNVFSSLSIEEKNKVSHRGKAVHLLKEFLTNI